MHPDELGVKVFPREDRHVLVDDAAPLELLVVEMDAHLEGPGHLREELALVDVAVLAVALALHLPSLLLLLLHLLYPLLVQRVKLRIVLEVLQVVLDGPDVAHRSLLRLCLLHVVPRGSLHDVTVVQRVHGVPEAVATKLTIPEIVTEKYRNQFLARVFQAIRIEVNDEITALEEMLLSAVDILNPGGRLVVMSYHSLEDRLVKNLMKKGNLEGKMVKDFYGNPIKDLKEINRKVIVASSEEIADNSRARSAKLRVAEKINEN